MVLIIIRSGGQGADLPEVLHYRRGWRVACVLCVGPQVIGVDFWQPAHKQLQLIVIEDGDQVLHKAQNPSVTTKCISMQRADSDDRKPSAWSYAHRQHFLLITAA